MVHINAHRVFEGNESSQACGSIYSRADGGIAVAVRPAKLRATDQRLRFDEQVAGPVFAQYRARRSQLNFTHQKVWRGTEMDDPICGVPLVVDVVLPFFREEGGVGKCNILPGNQVARADFPAKEFLVFRSHCFAVTLKAVFLRLLVVEGEPIAKQGKPELGRFRRECDPSNSPAMSIAFYAPFAILSLGPEKVLKKSRAPAPVYRDARKNRVVLIQWPKLVRFFKSARAAIVAEQLLGESIPGNSLLHHKAARIETRRVVKLKRARADSRPVAPDRAIEPVVNCLVPLLELPWNGIEIGKIRWGGKAFDDGHIRASVRASGDHESPLLNLGAKSRSRPAEVPATKRVTRLTRGAPDRRAGRYRINTPLRNLAERNRHQPVFDGSFDQANDGRFALRLANFCELRRQGFNDFLHVAPPVALLQQSPEPARDAIHPL